MLVAVEMVVTVVAGLSTPRLRLRLRDGNGEGVAPSISDKVDGAAEESEDESSRSAASLFISTFRDVDPLEVKVWTEDANDPVKRREGVDVCDAASVILAVSRAILEVLMACHALSPRVRPCRVKLFGVPSPGTGAGDLQLASCLERVFYWEAPLSHWVTRVVFETTKAPLGFSRWYSGLTGFGVWCKSLLHGLTTM